MTYSLKHLITELSHLRDEVPSCEKLQTAVIVGNGPSRTKVRLEAVPDTDIWGCNAIYRDYTPDFLVAVDRNMQIEIFQSGYHENNKCYFRNSRHTHPNITTFPSNKLAPNNSGVAAFYFAMRQKKYRRFIFLGFDFSNQNVYAGTKNYAKKDKPVPVRMNVQEKLSEWFVLNRGKAQFVRVIDSTCSIPNLPGFTEEYLTHYELHT